MRVTNLISGSQGNLGAFNGGHMITQYHIFYNQRHGQVCLVDEINGHDFVAFSGGNMISIFTLGKDGLLSLYDEFTMGGDLIENSYHAELLAREHILEIEHDNLAKIHTQMENET